MIITVRKGIDGRCNVDIIHHSTLPVVEQIKKIVRPGKIYTRRGGYILPQNPLKRRLFTLLRRVFSDKGRVAAWTRTWRGPWVIDLSPIGVCSEIGPFERRDVAIKAEEELVYEIFVLDVSPEKAIETVREKYLL